MDIVISTSNYKELISTRSAEFTLGESSSSERSLNQEEQVANFL